MTADSQNKIINSQSELWLRAIFDNAFQFIGLMSPDGKLLEANKSSLESVGGSRAEVIGRPFWETPWWAHSPELQQRLREAVKRAAAGESDRFESTHPTADGGLIHVDFSLTPVKDDSGNVIYLIPEGRNITKRKAMEEQLRVTNELFSATLNASRVIVFRQDCDLFYTWAHTPDTENAAADLIGKSDNQVIAYPAEAQKITAIKRAVLESALPRREQVLVHVDGKEYWYDLSVRPERDSSGAIIGILGTATNITEQKHTEYELRRLTESLEQRVAERSASLRHMSKVFTDAANAIFVKDVSGRIVDMNAAAERQYGWTRDELIGQSIKTIVPPEEHQHREELMARCLRGEEIRSVQATRITKHGDRLPVVLTLSLLTDDNGQTAGIATHSEDISQLKAAELDLQIKDYAINSAITGVAFGDLEGVITYVNPAFLKIFGYHDVGEVVGRRNAELTSDESVIEEIMTSVRTKGFWQGEDLAKRKDDATVPIALNVSLIKDANDCPLGIVATFIDISGREQAEANVREREHRLRAVLDAAVDSIISIDREGIIVDVNVATQQMFGYTAEELVGQNVKILMPSPYRDEHDQYIRNFLESGEAKIIGIGREVVGRRKDGSTFPMHLAVSEVQLSDRHLFTGIVRDISDLKDAQEKLVQSERLAAMGQMLSAIAHESRNSLQRIQAGVDMLQMELDDNDEARGDLARIERAGDNLRTLFEELRSYAAPIQLDRSTCDVSHVWQRAWSNLSTVRQDRDARLDEDTNGLNLALPIDEFRIEQVFRNLIENSLAACSDPVRIEISTHESELEGAPAVCVSVRDNGPGLTIEQKKRIFEAFFTTKSKGTGLGMAIAQRLIEAHEGTISVGDHDQHGGAEFQITLPRQ